jgi:hypothetical protein
MMPHLDAALQVAFGLPLGMAAGWIYFSTLHWSVRWLTSGAAGRAIGLQAARLGGLGLIFFGLAKLGPWILLAGTAGLLAARFVLVRRVRGGS